MARGLSSRRAFLSTFLLLLSPTVSCRRKESVCSDEATLAPADVKARQKAGYVSRTTDADRGCEKCQQWLEGQEGNCGGCKLLRGPIHPKATCRLFSPAS